MEAGGATGHGITTSSSKGTVGRTAEAARAESGMRRVQWRREPRPGLCSSRRTIKLPGASLHGDMTLGSSSAESRDDTPSGGHRI